MTPLGQIPSMILARKSADDIAIEFGPERLSWGVLDRRSTNRAWALKSAGIARNDWVTLALPNGVAMFEWLFAIWKLGATPHVVSDRLPIPELEGLLRLANPRAIIAESHSLQTRFGARPTDFGLNNGEVRPLPPLVADCWKAMSSGGSTGSPKIIVAPKPSVFDPTVQSYLGIPENGKILSTGPLYHNMPLVTSVRALCLGSKVIGLLKFDPEQALRLINDNQITWANFVPTMMTRISRLPLATRDRYDTASLRRVWHWAAPMPQELKLEWIKWLGAEKIWELYGGTEAIATTILNGEEWLAHRGSVGRPIGNKLKVLDDAGVSVPIGTIGEIFSLPESGQGSTYSYVGAEARSAACGYETLGDFGWMDDDGFLYIADRRSDLIVSGGANVYPAEVENALMAHPSVEAAVVIGLPDDDLGMVVHALVKRASLPHELADEASLAYFLRDRLVRYKIPRSFEFVTTPLRDDAGKVRRSQLQAERRGNQQTSALAAALQMTDMERAK